MQGGVLSPQLFNDFLSDLGEYLDLECGVKLDKMLPLYLLFADDLIFFTRILRKACKSNWTVCINIVQNGTY